ncbi:MAG: hypothetical protein ACLUV3_09445 [Oscillospiraceae bacterium]|jgi:hypothetical protein
MERLTPINEIKRIISSLYEQKNYWKMRYKLNGDEDSNKYATVIDMAIKALEDNIKLNKQREEIQNSKIKYYYRAKDAEDRCKTTEKQNKRLKKLLKLAFEEIERFYELNTGVRIVTLRYPEIKFDLALDKNDRQIWKYADEVEEVLKK